MSELPLLYHAHHQRHPEDIPFWLSLAEQTDGRILELGSGTGRVLLPLLSAGHAVLGVENDAAMTSFCADVVAVYPSAALVEADFTQLTLDDRFALIIMPCNTYSTLTEGERQRVLRWGREHLTPDGVFAFSMPNPAVLAELPDVGEREFEEKFLHPELDVTVDVYSAWRRDADGVRFVWDYEYLNADKALVVRSLTTRHMDVSTDTYLEEVRQAGFRTLELLGDFDGTEYDLDAPYLIVLAA